MLIIVAGSRWAGKAGRAAGWRAGTFGCGDANQAAGEGEEEREERGEGEFMDAKSASERTESGRLPATRDEISEQLYFAVWLLQGKREKKGGELGVSEAGGLSLQSRRWALLLRTDPSSQGRCSLGI